MNTEFADTPCGVTSRVPLHFCIRNSRPEFNSAPLHLPSVHRLHGDMSGGGTCGSRPPDSKSSSELKARANFPNESCQAIAQCKERSKGKAIEMLCVRLHEQFLWNAEESNKYAMFISSKRNLLLSSKAEHMLQKKYNEKLFRSPLSPSVAVLFAVSFSSFYSRRSIKNGRKTVDRERIKIRLRKDLLPFFAVLIPMSISHREQGTGSVITSNRTPSKLISRPAKRRYKTFSFKARIEVARGRGTELFYAST